MNRETKTRTLDAYWRMNLKYLFVLLSIWFVVSFGAGVLFRSWLDQFTIPGTGFKLGFWFAQQGSILVFVILTFVYTRLMNRLDDSVHDPDASEEHSDEVTE